MVKDKNLRVLDYIDGKEILIQMGEEGSELSKAAIKFLSCNRHEEPNARKH